MHGMRGNVSSMQNIYRKSFDNTRQHIFFLKLMPENQDHGGRLTVYVQIPLPQDVFTNQIWDS